MTVSLAASLIDLVLGLQLGSADRTAANRCTLEGVSWQPGADGAIGVQVHGFEASSLRLASGPLVLELGRIAVHELAAQLRVEAGRPRLVSAEARGIEFSDWKLHGPFTLPAEVRQVWDASREAAPAPDAAAPDAWKLGPLGEADGTIRAQITDAHLLFDADVTVPVRHGLIDFNDATVEHVGPDSRMGVSRMGLYVDAPNGRSYLYQFQSAPLAGVEFERRGALLSPWVSERGKLQLQAFAESMLRQGVAGLGQGLTEQARVLMGRTALSGELRLGDGLFAMPGLQVRLQGHEEGRNAIALRSDAVGRGLGAEIASLSARDAAATWKGMHLAADSLEARLALQVLVDGPRMRFELMLKNGKASGLTLGS